MVVTRMAFDLDFKVSQEVNPHRLAHELNRSQSEKQRNRVWMNMLATDPGTSRWFNHLDKSPPSTVRNYVCHIIDQLAGGDYY